VFHGDGLLAFSRAVSDGAGVARTGSDGGPGKHAPPAWERTSSAAAGATGAGRAGAAMRKAHSAAAAEQAMRVASSPAV
jgi:hypothetical protein